jgi:hypothetical protein
MRRGLLSRVMMAHRQIQTGLRASSPLHSAVDRAVPDITVRGKAGPARADLARPDPARTGPANRGLLPTAVGKT